MDFQGLCKNYTLLAVRCIPLDDRHGREVLAIVGKLMFDVSDVGNVTLAEPSAPVRPGDEPWPPMEGGTGFHSIRYPADFVDEKPGSEVLLLGTAHPPQGREVSQAEVRLRVLRADAKEILIDKALAVFGKRVYQQGTFGVGPGPAAPLEPTPLRWELAYGGQDVGDAGGEQELRNPVGMGVAVRAETLIGQPAHVIELAGAGRRMRGSTPAGFAPLGTNWSPRRERHGTYDQGWQRTRAPHPPADFDPRARCSAPDDQWLAEPLLGDELIEVLGATPPGIWRFQLPRYEPRFEVVVAGETKALTTHLDTYLIDADAQRVELSWRASFPLPDAPDLLDEVHVSEAYPLPQTILDQRRADPSEDEPS